MFIKKLINRFNQTQTNSKVIAKQTLYAFIIKGLSLSISFFSAPAFIKYFNNNEILGVWFTILSVLMWFLTFDLGIGNGIRNHLVKAITQNNRKYAREIISSGIAWSTIITIILGCIGYIIINNINLNSLLNVSPKIISPNILQKTMTLVFGAIIFRFLLSTVHSIFYALQKSAVNNFLSLTISLLLFLYVIIFKSNNPNNALLNIAYAYIIISNVPVLFAAIFIFSTTLRDCIPSINYITKSASKKVIGIGLIFFLCQISYMILSNTNEFFISHFWNPLFTTDYSFYYRITMLVSMLVSLALTPTWSMITKAYHEGNIEWVSKLYKIFKITGLIVTACQFILVPFQQYIMDIWLGKGQLIVKPSYALSFACFGSVALYSTMLSTIVCGLGKMKLQSYCFGFGAVAKIILICIIAQYTQQWIWVVLINFLILGTYCILEQQKLNKLFAIK